MGLRLFRAVGSEKYDLLQIQQPISVKMWREFARSSDTSLQKLPIPPIARSFTSKFCPARIGTKSESIKRIAPPRASVLDDSREESA